MIRHLSLSTFFVASGALVAASCASPTNNNSSGTAGTMGTGGSGGSGNTGGSSPPPPGLGSGGPFQFPQNKKSGSCSIAAGASSAALSAYNSWKSMFVTSNGAGGALRVQSPQHSAGTVSEGIGYGMIAAVYVYDRPTFDGLWSYAKMHLDSNGLMNWQISSSGGIVGMGSATDADEDMAWALLMASDQWSSTAYLDDAKTLIDNIYGTEIAGDGALKPDQYGGANGTTYDPDYFSPAYYRVFARATNNPVWAGAIIDRNYALLAQVSGPKGIEPNSTTTTNPTATGTYGYNACRMPWRIAMDYCFNGEPRAKAILDKLGPFFNGIGAANVTDGYDVATGNQTQPNHNMAFIGPAGVTGMAGWQTLLDGAYSYGTNQTGGDTAYFTNSLRVVTMLMMSGNLLDYSQQ